MVHICCIYCLCLCCFTRNSRKWYLACTEGSENDVHRRGCCRYKDGTCACQSREAFVSSVFFCTKVNPCNCMEGFRTSYCHEKYQPTPRLGLAIFSILRILIYTAYLVEEILNTDKYYQAYYKLPKSYQVPTADRWRLQEPEFLKNQTEIFAREQYIARKKFCSAALMSTLLGISILLYGILLYSTILNSYKLAYVYATLVPIPIVGGILYQPIQYSRFLLKYTLSHKDDHELYNALFWIPFWIISTLFTIYDGWMIYWFRKRIIVFMLEELGVRDISSTSFEHDVGAKAFEEIEVRQKEMDLDLNYPTVGNASYTIGNKYFKSNKDTPETHPKRTSISPNDGNKYVLIHRNENENQTQEQRLMHLTQTISTSNFKRKNTIQPISHPKHATSEPGLSSRKT